MHVNHRYTYTAAASHAERRQGVTVDELTNMAAQQASVAVTARDVQEALASIEGDIIRDGQRIRHKHAVV